MIVLGSKIHAIRGPPLYGRTRVQQIFVFRSAKFNTFCILYFQHAKSYFCDQHGNVICQSGWKQSEIHKDPLNPCTQPICSQGTSSWHRTTNPEYTNPDFFFTKMCVLFFEWVNNCLFFLGSTCVDMLLCAKVGILNSLWIF